MITSTHQKKGFSMNLSLIKLYGIHALYGFLFSFIATWGYRFLNTETGNVETLYWAVFGVGSMGLILTAVSLYIHIFILSQVDEFEPSPN